PALREPEGRAAPQHVPDLRRVAGGAGGLHAAGAAGRHHLLRPSLLRADDDQVRLRLRTGHQSSPPAGDHAAPARGTHGQPEIGRPTMMNTPRYCRSFLAGLTAVAVLALAPRPAASQTAFKVDEASIADIQKAIVSGQATCRQVVEAYFERARAFNGTCTALVTADGKPIAPATGAVRAGAPITFPTQTVAVSTIFPKYDEYAGLPLELGRMELTLSNPGVQQQWGMRVGIPNAGQLNALETLNIRGKRSVTCRGDFDRAPSAGPLPAGAPAECEAFRKLPDALERAAELDAQYGRKPDLAKMPMYCAVFSFKNWYDAKDMRGTGGNDVDFAMDVPKVDSPDVADLRVKGAIIYAIATADNVGGA